ncbi:MAG TPA: MqnA/MqnD/SBP family protein [Bacteroidota bacterium]|nr:MqnA/MqnD/SBP family protein [Bacteroidota bacterium]
MKSRLAISDALYVQPLLYGLDKPDAPFELCTDIPARNALKLHERSDEIRNAFLSPLDYARHGGEYCILPNICAASSTPTGTIQLILNSDLRNIERVAVDVRCTSEIILAKILLLEKYRNEPTSTSSLQFLPMMPDVDVMLAKADAALIVNFMPSPKVDEKHFVLDLVEEWFDLTELPYVHGVWVGRETELLEYEASALLNAKHQGVKIQSNIAEAYAQKQNLSLAAARTYLHAFSYDLGQQEEDSIEEFFHYAFYHGAIGDVPELRYFDLEMPNIDSSTVN